MNIMIMNRRALLISVATGIIAVLFTWHYYPPYDYPPPPPIPYRDWEIGLVFPFFLIVTAGTYTLLWVMSRLMLRFRDQA